MDQEESRSNEHNFVYFGHGWGHCSICHQEVEVQYPTEEEKFCPGPKPKKRGGQFDLDGYDCCRPLTAENLKQMDGKIREFMERVKNEHPEWFLE